MSRKNLIAKMAALLVLSFFLAAPAFGAQSGQTLTAGNASKAEISVMAAKMKSLEKAPNLPKKGTYYLIKMPYDSTLDDVSFNTTYPNDVTTISSSNASMIDFDSMNEVNPRFSVLKSGTTTISYTLSNGKSYSFVLKAIKYANPIKKLKIGSKSFASKLRKDSYLTFKKREYLTGKISIKAKKGWSLQKIEAQRIVYKSSEDWDFKYKKIKNNTLLKSSDRVKQLEITFKKKSNGVVQTIYVLADKWPEVDVSGC